VFRQWCEAARPTRSQSVTSTAYFDSICSWKRQASGGGSHCARRKCVKRARAFRHLERNVARVKGSQDFPSSSPTKQRNPKKSSCQTGRQGGGGWWAALCAEKMGASPAPIVNNCNNSLSVGGNQYFGQMRRAEAAWWMSEWRAPRNKARKREEDTKSFTSLPSIGSSNYPDGLARFAVAPD